MATKKKAVKRKKPRSKMSGVKKKSKKRSRMGSNGTNMTAILALIGGAVAAKMIDKYVPAGIDPKIVAAGKLAVGFMLPMVAKDANTKKALEGIGHGFLAVGTIDLLKEMNILSGAEETGNDLFIAMSGTQDILAGNEDINIINGDQKVLAGEEDLSIINGYLQDDDED